MCQQCFLGLLSISLHQVLDAPGRIADNDPVLQSDGIEGEDGNWSCCGCPVLSGRLVLSGQRDQALAQAQ